jgi:hypothetical protein
MPVKSSTRQSSNSKPTVFSIVHAVEIDSDNRVADRTVTFFLSKIIIRYPGRSYIRTIPVIALTSNRYT